jgi:hypothetical protein
MSRGPNRRKPTARSKLAIRSGRPPHSGHATRYAAAAGVKRRRQLGQQTGVITDPFDRSLKNESTPWSYRTATVPRSSTCPRADAAAAPAEPIAPATEAQATTQGGTLHRTAPDRHPKDRPPPACVSARYPAATNQRTRLAPIGGTASHAARSWQIGSRARLASRRRPDGRRNRVVPITQPPVPAATGRSAAAPPGAAPPRNAGELTTGADELGERALDHRRRLLRPREGATQPIDTALLLSCRGATRRPSLLPASSGSALRCMPRVDDRGGRRPVWHERSRL